MDDAIALRGGEARVTAYVERQPLLGIRRDVQGESVRVLRPPSPSFTAQTDSDGAVSGVLPFEEGGGDLIAAETSIDARLLRAEATLYTWDPSKTIVVVDVDHTICETDKSKLFRLARDVVSQPLPDCKTTLHALASDYQTLYLTARPRFLLDKTRHWLREHDFPPGPLVVSPAVRVMLKPTEFKTERIAELRAIWPSILIGIGNRRTDAEAYGANGMLTLMVNPSTEDEFGAHAVLLSDWVVLERFFAANRALLTNSARFAKALRAKEALLTLPLSAYQGQTAEPTTAR